MADAAGGRRKRTRNVLRQRLEAVASYAATVEARAEWQGPRADKPRCESEKRGRASAGAGAQAGLVQTAENTGRRTEHGHKSPQSAVWGGLEMLGLLTDLYHMPVTPLPSPRATPGPTPRRGKLPPLPEQEQWSAVVPAKQPPPQHSQPLGEATAPAAPAAAAGREKEGTRMQPRPDVLPSGSSTCVPETPHASDAHTSVSLRSDHAEATSQPVPSLSGILEDAVTKLVESVVAAARLNASEHDRERRLSRLREERLETAVCQLVTSAIAEARSLLASTDRDARLRAAASLEQDQPAEQQARAQMQADGVRQRKTGLEAGKQSRDNRAAESAAAVPTVRDADVESVVCKVVTKSVAEANRSLVEPVDVIGAHRNDELLDAATRLAVMRAIDEAKVQLQQEEQRRLDGALDTFVAALVAEARDSLRCQHADEGRMEGEGGFEERAFKDNTVADEAELGDSILSADATLMAGGHEDSIGVDSAAEAPMPCSATVPTCSVSGLPCSSLLDDVANPPQTGSQPLMQPPPFDNPPTATSEALLTSSTLLGLTTAVAEFNSQLAQVPQETIALPLAPHARTRVHP